VEKLLFVVRAAWLTGVELEADFTIAEQSYFEL